MTEEMENRFTSTGCAHGAKISRRDPCTEHRLKQGPEVTATAEGPAWLELKSQEEGGR